jgi:hypothetical protein
MSCAAALRLSASCCRSHGSIDDRAGGQPRKIAAHDAQVLRCDRLALPSDRADDVLALTST